MISSIAARNLSYQQTYNVFCPLRILRGEAARNPQRKSVQALALAGRGAESHITTSPKRRFQGRIGPKPAGLAACAVHHDLAARNAQPSGGQPLQRLRIDTVFHFQNTPGQ
jgi:hypothetical protein